MKRSSTSPLSIAALALAYMAGVITVAVLCCDDVILPGETLPASASPSIDGGIQDSPVLSDLAFVFREGIEDIAGMTASVIEDGSEKPLENVRLYRVDGALIVETQAEMNLNFRPHFYFLNREEQVVEHYRVNILVNHSLMTFHDQYFGENEETLQYHQPDEIQVGSGETAEITLEKKHRFWVDGQFVDLWQIVHLPADAQTSTSNCQLFEPEHLPSTVGITSDGTTGETVTLEVLP